MRTFFLTVLLFLALSSWAQSPAGRDFVRVTSFPNGGGDHELGLVSGAGGGGDPWSPDEMVTDGQNWYIHDPVNLRVVVLGRSWEFLRAVTNDNNWGYQLGNTPGRGVVQWSSYGTAKGPKDILWWSSDQDKSKPLADTVMRSFDTKAQVYSFLFQYQDVLIFQNHSGGSAKLPASFFGIRGLATTAAVKQSYLDDAAVRRLLADPKNRRYQVKGNLILDHGVPLIGDPDSFKVWFNGKGKWVDLVGMFVVRVTLPSDAYFLSDNGTFYVVDAGNGRLVQSWTAQYPLDNTLIYSSLFPAPDGYIYQLRGDYKAGETRLYRIGPYPELKLDYHGRGGTINDENVNLREDASTKAAAVTKLSKGTPVRILAQTNKPETIGGQKGVWYQVRLWDRTEGWVFGAFLDIGK